MSSSTETGRRRITHRWFKSGSYTLLGHIHRPQAQARHGVVIVPPFGWEEVCSYRPLREMAEMLSAEGIAVLRYDLPATGDSSGDASDHGLVDAWISSVDAAAAELRVATGVSAISVIGIRMGALLALAAAARNAAIGDLVLWGGAALGRTLLRELRAFRNLEVPEYSDANIPAPTEETGLEVGGFYLTPGTVAALEALDVSTLPPMPGRRVLALSRDDFASDKRLIAALHGASMVVEELPGTGYSNLMAVPHEATLPAETASKIADWLKGTDSAHSPHPPAALNQPAEPVRTREQIALLTQPSGVSFGILSPADPSPSAPAGGLWLLLLNPGAGRHIGPNRLWVDLAREWTARGVPSLRLDLAGIGESDGSQNLDVEGLYDEGLVAQLESAMEYLQSHHGARSFVAIGLCSGAFWAFHAATRNASVRAAILLNPRLFFWDPEVDRRREKLRNVNAVAKPDAWKRLVRGQVPAERIRSAVRDVFGRFASSESETEPTQIPAQAMNEALGRIAGNGARLSMIFTEGEPLLNEMEQEGFLKADALFHCLRIANAGHTFRPLWAQAELRLMINAELEAVLAGLSA